MNSKELIKETEVEAMASIERAAKNVNDFTDEINRLNEEVKLLQDANLNLRARILEFSKWSSEATAAKMPKEKVMPTPPEFPSGVYDDPGYAKYGQKLNGR